MWSQDQQFPTTFTGPEHNQMDYVTFLPTHLQWFPTALRINPDSFIRPAGLSTPWLCPSPWCCPISPRSTFLFLGPSKPIPPSESLRYCPLCSRLFRWLLGPSYLSLTFYPKCLLLRGFLPWPPYLEELPAPLSTPLWMAALCLIFCWALITTLNALHFCLSQPTRMQVLCEQECAVPCSFPASRIVPWT